MADPIAGWHDAVFLGMDYDYDTHPMLVFWFELDCGVELSFRSIMNFDKNNGLGARHAMLKRIGAESIVEAIGKQVRVEVIRYNKQAQLRQVCLPDHERPTELEMRKQIVEGKKRWFEKYGGAKPRQVLDWLEFRKKKKE